MRTLMEVIGPTENLKHFLENTLKLLKMSEAKYSSSCFL